MSSAEDIEELFLFLIFDDFIVNSSLEIIDSGGWLESEVNVLLLSGIYCDRVARLHRDKLLLQLFQLVVHIEGNLNFLLWLIEQTHSPRSISSHASHPEVDVLIFSFLQLQFQRNSFSLDLDDHFIQSINVKDDVFIIFGEVSWSKDNGYSQHIFFYFFHSSLFVFDWNHFNRKNDLPWRDLHIQIVGLDIVWLNRDGSCFPVSDLQLSCDRKRLFQDKAGPKVIIKERKIDSWYFGSASENESIGGPWDDSQSDRSIWFESKFILRSKQDINGELLVLFHCAKLVRNLQEGERVTCLYSKVKVKVSIVFNDQLSFLDFVHENASKVDLAFLILLDGVQTTA